jgi:hypothetical protein
MLGLIVNNLADSQQIFDITNHLNEKNEQCVVFCEEQSMCSQIPQYSIMPIQYAWHFDGTLVATTLEQASYIRQIKRNKHYYWVWGLDWLRGNYFEQVLEIYLSVGLICTSEEHQKQIEGFCGKRPHIIKNTKELFEWKTLKKI